MGCPYCGENISLDARICKHCQRPTLYSLTLHTSLHEKEKHHFLKTWQKINKSQFKHLPLAHYSQAKADLDTLPLTLAWDLNQSELNSLIKELNTPAIQGKLQGGLPSTFELQAKQESKPTHSWVYGLIAAIFFGGAIYFVTEVKKMENSRTKENAIHSENSPSIDLEITEPLSPQAQPREYPSDARILKPSNNLARNEVQHALNANVFIRDSQKLGSGFLISPDGYILSNAHVTSTMEVPIVVLNDGRQFEAKKIKENSQLDVSLIKIDASGLEYLKIGNANDLYPGQAVVAIGNPGGLSFTVTRGIVSYLGRNINGVPFIQTDAAINKGNSGGPMINENLEVVGINSLTSMNDHGISFALPINFVCSSGGVAEGVLSSCESFQGQRDPLTAQLSADSSGPKSSGSRTNYQQEADDFKEELNRAEKEIAQEESKLKSQKASVSKTAEVDPLNLSLRERVDSEVKTIDASLNSLPKKKAESQIRYINQMIALLERQRLDSAYSSLVPSIDSQISKLQVSRKQLQDFLRQ